MKDAVSEPVASVTVCDVPLVVSTRPPSSTFDTPSTEVNAIVPTVVVGAAGFEPAGSLPRAPSPASSTSVPALATPSGGMLMPPGDESATAIFSVVVDCEPSASRIV